MKMYGNLMNRFEENRRFAEIEPGTDITMYYYSDRTCYYITRVVNDKDIFVKRYSVCADQEKAGGMGHQNWLYFKTLKEQHEYLSQFFNDRTYNPSCEACEEEWVFRYNKWMKKVTFTEENHCTERELKSLNTKGYYNRYFDLSGKISFGVRDYYYDWEF